MRSAFRTPSVPAVVGAFIGAAVGLYPGMLPRTATHAAVVVAALVGLGALIGTWIARRRGPGSVRARRIVGMVGCSGFVAMVGAAALWQNGIRADVGVERVGAGWIAAVGLVPAVVFVAIVGLARVVGWTFALIGAVIVGYLTPTVANAQPAGPTPSATSVSHQADNLVRRWVDGGGLSYPTVVVAVPTGSGWVDEAAVSGFRHRFGSDVPVLSMPYSSMSSWRVFLTDRSAAGTSAIAVVSRIGDELRRIEPSRRPRLVLYGQSLGAVGADAARAWAQSHGVDVAETIEVGAPADTVAERADRRVLVANSTDPVPRWSPSLLWRPARIPAGTHIVGAERRSVPWLPIVSFLQASTDLLGALDVPDGAGHRYGEEQVLRR